MFAETDIIKRVPVDAVAKQNDKRLTPGIMHRVCDLVDVRPGILETAVDFHPTRLFHKKVDRMKETICLRIMEYICPEIAVPFKNDSGTTIENAQHEGFYMRYIVGCIAQHRKRWTPQHRFDLGVIGTFDALVGNGDRHGGNAMVTKHHVYPIDHGSTFYGPWQSNIRPFPYGVDDDDKFFRMGVAFALDNIARYATEIANLMDEVKPATTSDVLRWVNLRRQDWVKEERW